MIRYRDAEVIDRAPRTTGCQAITMSASVAVIATVDAQLQVTSARYPGPVPGFSATEPVEAMFHRWRCYRQGREPLPSMGYFVLTVLENRHGGRREAALALGVDDRVLRKLGELVSTRGDHTVARKDGGTPLRSEEKAWI